MSRTSIKTFLPVARKQLHHAVSTNGKASFVIGNESADLDSIVCALIYGYIQSNTILARRANSVTIPVTTIPASDLSLRPELTALLRHAGLQPSDIITLDDLGKVPLPVKDCTWTLVDHNVLQGDLGREHAKDVHGVIDHHDDEHKVPEDATPRIIEKSGSCCSLVTNHCRDTWDELSSRASSVGAANGQDQGVVDDLAYTSTWDAQIAKLALGAVLIDTANLKDESKVTDHDQKAIKYLEAIVNSSARLSKTYDRNRFYKEISTAKSDLDGLSLDDILRKDYKQWSEHEPEDGNEDWDGEILTLGISSVVKPLEYVKGGQTKLEFIKSLLDFARKRKLSLFAIMTAYTADSGAFARQLLLLSTTDSKAEAAARHFVQTSAKDLQLELSDMLSHANSNGDIGTPFLEFWSQRKLGASRKQVAPLLREAMRRAWEK